MVRIHLNYVGFCEEKMFLIIIDSYSKGLDEHTMNTATSSATSGKLRHSFMEYGLLDQCVTDNAICFTSSDFEECMTINGLRHITSDPYHLAMNGQEERVVKSFKDS